MKKTDCHVYPFVKAVYWWFLIVYILIVRTRVPYYIGIKWYNIITCILFSSLTFQIHIHIHIFTSEVTCYFCYFCYRPTILLPLNPFLPFYPFTFKTASRRSRFYVATGLAQVLLASGHCLQLFRFRMYKLFFRS